MSDWLPERLWSKIRLEPCPKPGLKGPCWIWTDHRCRGYGRITWKSKPQIAHRLIYRLSGKTLRDGLTIDHLCENKPCVNPEHCEPVTLKENLLRCARAIATVNASKTHCLAGHLLAGNNLRLQGIRRQCIACHRRRNLDYYRRIGKFKRKRRNA